MNFIKKDYGNPQMQDDLRDDSIYLFTKNMSALFFEFNKRTMSADEQTKYKEMFGSLLGLHNGDIS